MKKLNYLIFFLVALLCLITGVIIITNYPLMPVSWPLFAIKLIPFALLFIITIFASKLGITSLTLGLALFSYVRFLGFINVFLPKDSLFLGNLSTLVYVSAAILTAYAGIKAVLYWRIFEKKYREIYSNTKEIFFIVDKEKNTIVETSRSAIDYFGKSLLNREAGKCLGERNSYILCGRAHDSKKVPKTFEAKLYKSDGTQFYADVLIDEFSIFKKDYYYISIRDISEKRQAESLTKKAHERFKGLFENNNDAVFFLDREGRHIDANEKAVELLGYSVEELRKMTFYDVVPPEAQKESEQLLLELRKKGSLPIYEKELLRKNGERITVEINVSLIRHDDGDFHIQSIVRDVTKRKETQRLLKMERDMLQKFLTIAQTAVVILDISGNIKYLNTEGFRLFGYSADNIDEVVGKNLEEFVPENNKKKVQEIIKELVRGEKQSVLDILIPISSKNGETKTILWNAVASKSMGDNSVELLFSGKATDSYKKNIKFNGFYSSLNKVTIDVLETGTILGKNAQRLLKLCVATIPGAQAGTLIMRNENGNFSFVACENYDFKRLREVRLNREPVNNGLEAISVTADFCGFKLDSQLSKAVAKACKFKDLKATLVIPIILNGKVVALFNLNNFESKHAFDNPMTKQLAEVFKESITSLIKRLELEKELKTQKKKLEFLSNHDPLTELPNRRFLWEYSDLLFALAKRKSRPVSVLYVDLDKFKEINDFYGHDMGDYVLREVAGRFKDSIRKSDVTVRLGGDEFALLLPETDSKLAIVAAKRILLSIEKVMIADRTVSISGTIGISCFPEHGEDLQDLLKKADTAMYQAKKSGMKIAVYPGKSMHTKE
ncbi:hypothetical protein AT15_00245 [Kosmotoga arenicorallina S304]|uniref:Diguanylate cyclase n=1 Tax=Kosmotoga arenicorallina S304 TaxID=1453497 RepID=A0A176K1A7_9BACT|nr:diguanylate cyclase [Kosmotoga arenicorallina]OAA30391.1 hypothetical protein AT15_00245 [Kosmotoga arenicorallina S304]